MKNKIIIKVSFLVLTAFLFSTCEKTPMEKAQDAYDASMVVPAVLSVSGPSLALQTFAYDYTIGYYRAGSSWSWSAVDATVQSVSSDKRKATILFDTKPANDTALVKVTETTIGGVTSAEKIIKVRVDAFCPLANGPADLVGAWEGDDGGGGGYVYPSAVTSALDGETLTISGIGTGFIADFWGEEVITAGDVTVTINNNGTLEIPRQFVFTTLYEGDEYDYEIAGTGTWDNCGATPAMKITYDIYYPGDAAGLAATYKSYLDGIGYLTADIAMSAAAK